MYHHAQLLTEFMCTKDDSWIWHHSEKVRRVPWQAKKMHLIDLVERPQLKVDW
jgi:hypothetical protein